MNKVDEERLNKSRFFYVNNNNNFLRRCWKNMFPEIYMNCTDDAVILYLFIYNVHRNPDNHLKIYIIIIIIIIIIVLSNRRKNQKSWRLKCR